MVAISKSAADRAGEVARENAATYEFAALAGALSDIHAWRQTHEYPLALVTPGVRNWVSKAASGEVVVGQRLKRTPQIISKLRRFPTMRLSQMEDIAGCRAVLKSSAEVDAVAHRIRGNWDVRLENDYRSDGKARTGYRSLHLIVIRRDRLVEVQLRTERQHYWAEMVERTASRTGFALKDGLGPPELLAYFRVASEITWLAEEGLAVDKGLQRKLAKLRDSVRPFFTPT